MTVERVSVVLAALAIVVTIVIAIVQSRSKRRATELWATRAAEALGHARSVLRDSNPAQLVVGFSKLDAHPVTERTSLLGRPSEAVGSADREAGYVPAYETGDTFA